MGEYGVAIVVTAASDPVAAVATIMDGRPLIPSVPQE